MARLVTKRTKKLSTLGLPTGSVRGLLALLIVVPTVFGAILGWLLGVEGSVPGPLWALAGAVAEKYFEHRRNGGGGG